MARCPNCTRESPSGSVYCLNCGTRLADLISNAPQGLPGGEPCFSCGGTNQPGMNFCRHCGAGLPTPGAAAVQTRLNCTRCGGQTPPGFAFCQHCGANLASGVAPQSQPPGPPMIAAPPSVQVQPVTPHAPGRVGPPSIMAPNLANGGPFAGALPGVPSMQAPGSPALAAPQNPPAFQAVAPSPQNPPAFQAVAPSPQGAIWGTLIAIKRDGSDGDRTPLAGEWMDVGREGDLRFQDRYLAPRHARFEKTAQGPQITPLDTLNGVFRRLRPGLHPLTTGAFILAGRELLRFDVVEAEERDVAPLVRAGISTFGSPPRAPWGRISQMLANGAVRDVRYVYAPEMVLGREEGDIVVRDDEFLSRRHISFRYQNNQCTVEDLRSSNGSFIRLRTSTPLELGDIFRMGDQMFRYEPT